MRVEHCGIIAARGIGIGLIILGLTSAISSLPFFDGSVSAWTSYSPLTTTASTSSTYHFVSMAGIFLPCLAQIFIGSAMVLFPKPIGRWLARGIKEESSGDD